METTDAKVDLDTLLKDAAGFAAAAAGGPAGPGRELFDAAYALLTASDAPGGAAAERLVNSVLRPLAAALGSMPDSALSIPAPAAGSWSDRLWDVAQAATRLRCQPGSPPGLAEATAALQGLAAGGARDRIEGLRRLQADLPAGIQVSPDGPFLATNAEAVTNHLGLPVATTPTTAFCRCGGSAMKPFCDGTHARIGFSGAKDPKRVPDRRDAYPGVQVTVLDNRGTCQHAGFCTDRQPGVFHVGSEPFATPSGGPLGEIIQVARACPSGALSFAIDGREAREQVDQALRPPGIEITRDGPYRITGGLPLAGGDGSPEPRGAGASLEHYALCRCGHSLNKPFCSGMHWYIDFHDPVPDPDREPTLFEWAGGLPFLRRTTRIFFQKYVSADPLLAPLFDEAPPDQADRVADWIAEAFGGPAIHSQTSGGSSPMRAGHEGTGVTEAQRARWVELFTRAADDALLPADAAFRSALTSYLEWESRGLVAASQPDTPPAPDGPIPRWGWGPAGPPQWPVVAPTTEEEKQPTTAPAEGEAVSFATHIKPLFRESDRHSMSFVFDLWSHDEVTANAQGILERLQDGSMPCDDAWPAERIQVFQRWIDSGLAP